MHAKIGNVAKSCNIATLETAQNIELHVFWVFRKLLEAVKKVAKVAKTCPSHNKASSMPLFHKLNLLTLNDVFKLEIVKVMHNIENNEHLPDYISKNFERVNWTHNCNTRYSNKGNYVLPKIRTETGKNQ